MLAPVHQGAFYGLEVKVILDRVFLKDFVCDAFKIVSQGLEGCLEDVLVAGTESFKHCLRRLLLLKPTHEVEVMEGVDRLVLI